MEAIQKEIEIVKAKWFDDVRGMILRAENCSSDEIVWIENQIRSDGLSLFTVFEEGVFIGIFTARWSRLYNGTKVLNVIHGVSAIQQKNFMSTIKNPLKKMAKDCGFNEIRIHAKTEAMERRLTREGGYHKISSIYGIEVS